MTNNNGWRGLTVRNVDGRTGKISREEGFGPWLDLHIQCTDGSTAKVTLNSGGPDSGDAGWQWWCPEFSEGAAWLRLGEIGADLVYGQPPLADSASP